MTHVAILRLPEVRQATGLSTSTIYRLMGRGKFPRQRQLADNAVGWMTNDVTAWIEQRPLVHT